MKTQMRLLLFLAVAWLMAGCSDGPTATHQPPSAPSNQIPPPTTTTPNLTPTVPPTSEQQIGRYTIRLWSDKTNPATHLGGYLYGIGTISAPGLETIILAGAQSFYELPATDITGEGDPDLLIRFRNGGSHCCVGFLLYNLGAAPTQLLRLSGGFGSIGGSWLIDDEPIRDLDGDGHYEIIGREAANSFLIPCTVPSAMMVLGYSDGAYHNVGNQYPELFAEEITQRQARVDEFLAAQGSVDRCPAIELLLTYIYAGQPEAGWALFDELYKGEDKAQLQADISTALADPALFLNQ